MSAPRERLSAVPGGPEDFSAPSVFTYAMEQFFRPLFSGDREKPR